MGSINYDLFSTILLVLFNKVVLLYIQKYYWLGWLLINPISLGSVTELGGGNRLTGCAIYSNIKLIYYK